MDLNVAGVVCLWLTVARLMVGLEALGPFLAYSNDTPWLLVYALTAQSYSHSPLITQALCVLIQLGPGFNQIHVADVLEVLEV
jgi:hypothetical protein